jgi:hypothetical protein
LLEQLSRRRGPGHLEDGVAGGRLAPILIRLQLGPGARREEIDDSGTDVA